MPYRTFHYEREIIMVSKTMITGEELLHELTFIECLVPTRICASFDALSPDAMVLAQIELLRSGYVLVESTMDEGHFYRQRFMPGGRDADQWPDYVELRYMTDAVTAPPLALMYFEHDTLHQYHGAGYRTTYYTDTRYAVVMRSAFERDHPHVKWFWMPVFTGTPLALV